MAAATSSVAALKDRIIEPDDQAFIETFMADNNQEVYWQGWVVLYTKSNAAAKKERILVVTNFRVFTVKHGVLKRSTRQSLSVLDLEEITIHKDNDNQVHLVFGGQELDVQSDQIVEIVQAIIFAYKAVTYGLPREKLPKIELPAKFYDGFVAPEPDTQDGLLASYCAACDYVGTPQKLPVLDYLMTGFEIGDKVLDLGECLGPVDKVSTTDIQTVAAGLRYTHWFDELIAVDYAVRDEGLSALARVFGTRGSIIKKLVLVNIKAGKVGFSALAHEIALGFHGLNYLNISKNPLGDAGLKTILDALLASNKVLGTLCLQSCGFSSKGFKELTTVLSTPAWRVGLKVLDVSDNSAGKAGTTALAEYLAQSTGLEQLYCMRCDVVPELLLEALSHNAALANQSLATLNLSGNKMTKPAVPLLCTILRQSGSLSHVYLVDCALTRSAFVELMEAALDNAHGARFWLELTNNDLGTKGAKELAEALQKRRAAGSKVESLHTLILNANSLGADGVIALCNALTGLPVHTLSIDNNIKLGMFAGNGKEAGEAVAHFMNNTPSLRELSISGDDSHYLKAAGNPIITALKTNTSLQYLDISRNRLGDDGVKLLADALLVNRSLTSFTAERNRVGIKGLRELHQAVLKNTALTDWAIPMTDIENIHNSSSVKVAKELKQIVFDFEMAMERNLEAQTRAAAPAPQLQSQSEASLSGGAGGLFVPVANSRRASLHQDSSERRGEPAGSTHVPTRKVKHHNRVASSLFASLAKDKLAAASPDDLSTPQDGDGDVDADADEPSLSSKPEVPAAEQS